MSMHFSVHAPVTDSKQVYEFVGFSYTKVCIKTQLVTTLII